MTLTKFPLANDTNATNLMDIVKYDNSVTHGMFIPVILLVIWAIVFIGLAYADKSKAFMTATFLIWVLALFTWAMSALDAGYMVMFTVVLLLSMMYSAYIASKGTG
jgi:hypothetical protein